MSIEDQIAELLAQAEPLRALPDDEAEEKGLPGIVTRINALRARQANGETEAAPEADKPRRGRPPKAAVEGAEA